MSRKRNPIPSYRLHKQSGNAITTVYASDGRRRDVLLGKYNTPESKAEYRRIISELAASPAAIVKVTASKADTGTPVSKLTIAELICLFWEHAERHYINADGTPSRELDNFSTAIVFLRQLYDHTLAAEFGPLALKTIRHKLIDAGICRKTINQRIAKIKFIFKWACSEELIPASVFHALQSVSGLQRGKSAAKDHKPIKPVSDSVVDATLPHCSRPVATMLRLLRVTGMRPGELCIMRPMDLDTTGSVWMYNPASHKSAHCDKSRVIFLGPQAQLIVKPYLADCPADEFVFSPIRERQKRFAEMRRNRKSKVQPSQVDRSKPVPQLKVNSHYNPKVLAHNVGMACKKAGVSAWFPYQLRHSFATNARKEHGLEAAQVLLGHSKADVTQVYAERDHDKARSVVAMVG